MKFIFTCLFCAATIASVFAQSNYQKGFIITDNDTIQGYINVREWERSPTAIDFRKTVDGPTQIFTTRQLQYFKAPGFCSYQRFVVSISMNEVTLNRNLRAARNPNISDTVLLKVLSDGDKVKLFLYRDQLKPRFYYLMPGQTIPEELYYDVFRNGGLVSVREGYKNQLMQCARNNQALSKKLETKIKHAGYSEAYLIDIVQKINGNESRDTSPEEPVVEKQSTGFFIGAGVNRNVLILGSGVSGISLNTVKKTTYNPYVFAGYDIALRPQTGRLFFRVDMLFSKASLQSTATSKRLSVPAVINYSFTQTTTSLGLNLLYNFYSMPNLKIRGGAGLRANAAWYKNSRYTFTTGYPGSRSVQGSEPAMSKFWLSIPIRVSCLLHKHYEIGVGYIPVVNLSDISESFSNNLTTLFMGLNYHF